MANTLHVAQFLLLPPTTPTLPDLQLLEDDDRKFEFLKRRIKFSSLQLHIDTSLKSAITRLQGHRKNRSGNGSAQHLSLVLLVSFAAEECTFFGDQHRILPWERIVRAAECTSCS